MLNRARLWLRAVVLRHRIDREMQEEMAEHLERATARLMARGLPPEESRRHARREFGNVPYLQELSRDARGVRWLQDLGRDIRYALRRLIRDRGFSVPVVLTLALGIGATSAIFALVDAVLLRPLPYADAGRLVAIHHAAPGLDITQAGLSDGTYLHYQKYNRVFDGMGLYMENDLVSLTDRDDPERVHIAFVTPSIFSVLGATPLLGRLFTAADVQSPMSVVISHDLWVRRYGADPGIIGRTIELNRTPHEVVGVLPPDFDFPRPGTQLWYAMPVSAGKAGVSAGALFESGIARLRPGVSPEDAQADLQRLIPSLADVYPDVTRDFLRQAQLRAIVVPLKDAMVGDVREPLVILLCTVGFVFLIAWANVANLVMVRSGRLQREIAVVRALGATGGDLARWFLSESLMLASLGAGLGLAVAYAAVAARFGFEAGQIPRLHEVRMDGIVLAATVGLAVMSALLLCGVALARVGHTNFTAALKGAFGRMTGGREWQRAQRLLVALQVALALTLLIGSAVMVQSFRRLQEVEIGFEPTGVLTFDVPLPPNVYSTDEDAARFHQPLLERLRAIPGVTAAEEVMLPPLGLLPSYLNTALLVDGRSLAPGEQPPTAWVNIATAGYFRAMGIPLLRGRTFQSQDAQRKSPAVVISATLARTLFGGGDPIGRTVRRTGSADSLRYTVVGVVGDVLGETMTGGPVPMLYTRFFDHPQINLMSVVARTTLPPTSLVSSMRQVVDDLDPKVPMVRVRTMSQIVTAAMARARLMTLLLLLAAAAALLLGLIGLYGVIAYAVSQRTRELGLRLALGASPGALRRMVLRQGALIAAGGIAVGLLAAFALTRFLDSVLFEVSPRDPLAFAVMTALLSVVALVATYFPARRAGRIDPMQVLKEE